MSTKSLLVFFTLLQATVTLHSQNIPVTNAWDFICESYAYTGMTKVRIAKSQKGGKLELAVETTNTSFAISGTVYIDLADNSVIVCTEKGLHSVDRNLIISNYSLTTAEMNHLRKTDILSMRFAIKGKNTPFSSQIGHFTAINKKAYFATTYKRFKNSYATAAAIDLLYN